LNLTKLSGIDLIWYPSGLARLVLTLIEVPGIEIDRRLTDRLPRLSGLPGRIGKAGRIGLIADGGALELPELRTDWV